MGRTGTRARGRAALRSRLAAARGAAWALRTCVAVHRQLPAVALDRLALAPVPELPRGAGRGVDAVLRRARWSCLERAVVRQRWLAGRGSARDLVIGVSAGPPFAAHAWLDGDPASESAGYEELSRHPARAH